MYLLEQLLFQFLQWQLIAKILALLQLEPQPIGHLFERLPSLWVLHFDKFATTIANSFQRASHRYSTFGQIVFKGD